MIYLGEKKVGSIYLGDKKLSKIYLGEKLVWEGYPGGHIIGTATEAGIDIYTSRFYPRGSSEEVLLSCTTDTNKRFDLDTCAYDVGYSTFFQGNDDIVTIDSFKVRFYTSSIEREISDCNSLLRADVNGIKFLYTYITNPSIIDGDKKIEMQSFLYGCDNLKYIKAGGLEWGKVESIKLTFRNLPSLAELDLSGADFDNITIDRTCFAYIGTVGTVVKVIGCSATTQNKILNALNTNNRGQTWVLKDGVITRTS